MYIFDIVGQVNLIVKNAVLILRNWISKKKNGFFLNFKF